MTSFLHVNEKFNVFSLTCFEDDDRFATEVNNSTKRKEKNMMPTEGFLFDIVLLASMILFILGYFYIWFRILKKIEKTEKQNKM